MSGAALRVAIIGGGIGGMAAAAALTRKQIDVRLYEQAPVIAEVGAGVFLMPNGVRALAGLGLSNELQSIGAPVGEGSYYCRWDGSEVAPIQTTDSQGKNRKSGVHRADLLELLSKAVPADKVFTNHRCVGVDQSGSEITVLFDGQASVTADVVIAADGIHSTLQSCVTPPSPPVHSGYVAYRGLLPAAEVPQFPPRVARLWMGPDRHFLVFPVRRGQLLNYVGFVPQQEETGESWSAPGDPRDLVTAFAGWDDLLVQVVASIESCFWWGLYDREPLSTWTNGRLTLLGDAGHPMLPHLGQGANQAIEDATVLAECLAGASPDSAPAALQTYEALRRPRTTKVQINSRLTGQRFDAAAEDLTQRDREVVESVDLKLWLYDHDARQHARDHVAKVQAKA
jgi:salicylate hydroxylase